MHSKIKIVILAAGKGVRMGGDLPKVLTPMKDQPMLSYVLKAVEKSGIDEHPIIVVGYKKELIVKEFGNKYQYVNQAEQLGTGHAVSLVKNCLEKKAENIMVLYGDHPFLSAETIKKISEKHLQSGKKITMATVKLPDFKDWRISFVNFSRIIRGGNGKILKDVQFKDASDKEIKITEINPCYFCFDAVWLWEKLQTLKNDNAQKEYYLTDLIKIATSDDAGIESIDIEPYEALGANTKAELEILEKLVV